MSYFLKRSVNFVTENTDSYFFYTGLIAYVGLFVVYVSECTHFSAGSLMQNSTIFNTERSTLQFVIL